MQLALLRPYKKGLILHQVYYANKVRLYDEVELGEDKSFSQGEEDLAAKLIDPLASERFQPDKYSDEYSGRVQKAAEEKVAGQQVTLAPEQPAAQIVDLFEALKRSLGEASAAPATGTEAVRATGTEGAPASAGAAKQTKAKPARLKGPRKASLSASTASENAAAQHYRSKSSSSGGACSSLFGAGFAPFGASFGLLLSA